VLGGRRRIGGGAGRAWWLWEWLGGWIDHSNTKSGETCRSRNNRLKFGDTCSSAGVKSSAFAKSILIAVVLIIAQLETTKEVKAQNRCQAAIDGVTSDIQERIGAVIASTKRVSTAEWKGDGEIMQTYKTPFNNADEIVVFYLASDMGRGSVNRKQGQAAENIMNSSQLTREYAQQIISACDPVASVKFFYWEWYQGWSLHRNNELVEDKCKNPDGSNYYWGENVCV